jgi:hypothetical protein
MNDAFTWPSRVVPLSGTGQPPRQHLETSSRSNMARNILQGWPCVLSSLKSLLETERAVKTWAR